MGCLLIVLFRCFVIVAFLFFILFLNLNLLIALIDLLNWMFGFGNLFGMV